MYEQNHMQVQFFLSPDLAQIMVLLMEHDTVPLAMIETDHKITQDGAVAVHRLRRRLAGTGVKIENVRGLGYFITKEHKKIVNDLMETNDAKR